MYIRSYINVYILLYIAPSRPSSSLSQQSTSSIASSVNLRVKPTATPRRPRPASIAITGISSELKNSVNEQSRKSETKPPLPKSRKSSLIKSSEKLKKKSASSPTETSTKSVVSHTNSVPTLNSPIEKISITEVNTDDLNVIDAVVNEAQTKEMEKTETTETEMIE